MASLPTELTPQERLAITRKAIVRHMNRHRGNVENQPESTHEILTDESRVVVRNHGGLSKITSMARMWWHRHPASAAVELASPLLDSYARTHPFKLVGISVAAGALLVVIKPWRMVSASTLLVTAVKSSGLSNTLMTMLSSFVPSSGNADRPL